MSLKYIFFSVVIINYYDKILELFKFSQITFQLIYLRLY